MGLRIWNRSHTNHKNTLCVPDTMTEILDTIRKTQIVPADDNMLDLENLPEPDVLAQEIIENIQAALDSFKEVALKLEE